MKNYKELALQSLLVFLSVFLGIMASNFNNYLEDKNKRRKFLEAYLTELASNQRHLEGSIAYHAKLKQTLDSIRAGGEFPQKSLMEYGGISKFPQWKGLGIYPQEEVVYEMGIVGGVLPLLSIDLLSGISKQHLMLEEYRRFSQGVSNKLMALSYSSSVYDLVVVVEILASDMLLIERQIQERQQKLKAMIEQELSK